MKWLWLLAVSLSTVAATVCPGGSQCPGVETCCLMSSGQYGCCPYPRAECCSDHQHCCPSGYTCVYNRCVQQANSTSSENALIKITKNKKCPGSQQDECPNKFTCCPSKQAGRYECCPLPNAACCEDNIHCCPSGYTCDLVKQQCKLNDISMPLIRKTESTFAKSSELLIETAPATPANTICPDPRYSCSGADTCCRTPGGTWTCCIYPYGTCCSDGLHCCPYGMSCLQSYHCVKGNVTIPTKPSPLSEDNSRDINTVVCPDQYQCPNGNTCCMISGGAYGCCPLPNAVCCSDHTHCCPHGFTCNVQSRSCSDGITEMPWFTKTPTF